MAHIETQQPTRTLRGTWAEILSHRDEIPATSQVEVNVYEHEPANRISPLGEKLLAIREQYIAEGGRLYTTEEIEREVADARRYDAQ